jgi:acid phosphatase type 7
MSVSSASSPRAVSALGTARRLLVLLASAGLLWAALPVRAAADPVIAAAGDIACDPTDPGFNGGSGTATRCRQRATSNLLVGAGLAAVLPLGDVQYNSAALEEFAASYNPSWGRVKSISRPILGNHESHVNDYFDYFNGAGAANGRAGPRGRGYYSFDVGSWHLIALNSNCTKVPCSAGSQQERWLRADLAAHPAKCTLAYWHHARYSSGHDGNNTFVQPFWNALQDAGADVVLNAHSHNYERFAPMNRNGGLDGAHGIREFVVGTGGAFFTGGISTGEPNSQVRQNTSFGVLKLTLHPFSYDWRFQPIAGSGFTDSGSALCHWPATPPPPAVDRFAPVVTHLRLSPRRFRAGVRHRGAIVRYTVSEAAKLRFRIARRVRSHRYRRVDVFKRAGRAGRNRWRYHGTVGRRRLRPGLFRASVRAIDRAGNRSRVRRIRFRIVR